METPFPSSEPKAIRAIDFAVDTPAKKRLWQEKTAESRDFDRKCPPHKKSAPAAGQTRFLL